MNRRYFLFSSLAGAYAARRTVAASDKVTVAFMGVNGRGRYLQQIFCALPDVDVAYVCDVDRRQHEAAARAVESAKGKRPALVTDIRRVLEDKSGGCGRDGDSLSTGTGRHHPRLRGGQGRLRQEPGVAQYP